MCDDARIKKLKLCHLALLVHFVVFVFAFTNLHIIVFTFVVALYLVIYSICYSFIFISSFCTLGLLVVIHSFSHRHFHVCNYYLHLVVYAQFHKSSFKLCVWYSQFGWKDLFTLFNSQVELDFTSRTTTLLHLI